MLLAAADVNPHVELVGQDIDARCARITAINLGLRGRYGWVVCANSLTGETRFTYRIGSFFNETPNGLRRGVIRDVPPEQTPLPVIAEHMRRDTKDLFQTDAEHEAESAPALPTIIEVPQWLARLEPQLADLDSDEAVELPKERTDGKRETSAEPKPSLEIRSDTDCQMRQLHLF